VILTVGRQLAHGIKSLIKQFAHMMSSVADVRQNKENFEHGYSLKPFVLPCKPLLQRLPSCDLDAETR
jgi:hypothetical protein